MRTPASYHDLLTAGVTRRRLRTAKDQGNLVRPWRGVYSVSDDEIAAVQALFRLLPPEARLAGPSAAAWHGFGTLAPVAPVAPRNVHIVVPQGHAHPRLAGVTAGESVLPLPRLVTMHDVPILPAARVAVDLARRARRLDALPVLDAALRSGAVTHDDLLAEIAAHAGLRGIRQARDLVPLADGRAECRQESQLRLIIADGGLPVPEPQLQVGWFRLDLGYRAQRVGVEYDGSSHLTRDRLRADRSRMNWLADHGWTMRHFTDQDIYRNPAGILRTLRHLLQ